jgi:hypothetical protein
MKTVRIGDVQNALVRLILWQVDREPIADVHLRAAKDYFNNQCAYCGETKKLVFDHAVPINRTTLGQHRIGNLVPSCADCNQKKGQRDFRDYLRDDPDSRTKIMKILEYMKRGKYVPLSDNEQVKALLDTARKEIADTATKSIAAVNKLLADFRTTEPLSPADLPALSPLVSTQSNGRNGSMQSDSDWAKIAEIRKAANRSWINLRRGCLDQMGVSVYHGTPKVRASSRAFAKKVNEATGLKYADIIALLDQQSLGLDPKG